MTPKLLVSLALVARLSPHVRGQAYEIANLVDPSFTVVAKAQKSLLVRR